MTTEYEKAMDAQPVAWVAADTLRSPHPVCVSSLAYMSQLDKDRGREYVPLYAAPVAAQGEDDAWCAECGVKLENVRPGKHQHPICSQAVPLEAAREDAERYRWLRLRLAGAEHVSELVEFNTDMHPDLPGDVDAAIDQARGKGVADEA